MKKIIILLLPVITLFSCGNEKQLFHIESSDILETAMLGNRFIIFCYIDSTNCNPCIMQWLHRWTYFEDELKKLNTGIVLIVRNSDEEAVHSIMEHLRLDFPVIFDKNSTIRRQNGAILWHHSVFVINRKKEIVWLGLPIENQASWDLFRRTLRRQLRFKR